MGLTQPGGGTGINPGAGQIFDGHTFRVSTKESWGSSWTDQPNLIPIRATRALAPSISTAYFRFNFGDRTTETDPNYTTLEARGLKDHYVQIEIFADAAPSTPIDTWIGQLVHDGRKPKGFVPAASGNMPGGIQLFTAYGLEHLLKKMPINESRVLRNNQILRIQRGITFNKRQRRGGVIEGNMNFEPGTSDPVFDSTGQSWDHFTIVKYLINNFVNERTTPQFQLALPALTTIPDTVEKLFGMNVYDAINKLIDRRRGLCWYIRTDGITVEIVIRTTLDTGLSVGQINIPANPNQVQIDVDTDIRVAQFVVNESTTNRYSEVQVRGAPIRVMMTVSFADETLEADWTQAEEQLYIDAAKDTTGYNSLTVTEQARLNDKFRKENKFVSHVYRRFKIPQSWDGRVGNGLGANPGAYIALPEPEQFSGTVGIGAMPADFFPSDKTLLRELLNDLDADYTGPFVFHHSPPGAETQLDRPFLTLAQILGPIHYHNVSSMGGSAGNNLPSSGMKILDRGMRFELILPDGVPNHAWALTDWDPETAEPSLFVPTPSNTADFFSLLATVAIETDQRPFMRVDTLAALDNNTTLIIEFPDVHYWYAVPDTVMQVSDDSKELVRLHPNNRVIRDDTQQLRDMGAFVHAWYGRERRSVRLMRHRFDTPEIGTILQSVALGQSQTQVNSLISAVEFDFVDMTAAIVTDFQELDFGGILGGRAAVSTSVSTAGPTPSLGSPRHRISRIDERLNWLERRLDKISIGSGGNASGITDAFIGKVVEYYRDRCFVARMEYGDPEQWNLNTFTDIVKCVWKGVGTSIVSNDPVFCFKPANSSKYVALAWFNDVGNWDDAGGTNGEFHFNPPSNVIDPDPSATSAFPPFGGASNSECIPGTVP